jgi:hypothetical protein
MPKMRNGKHPQFVGTKKRVRQLLQPELTSAGSVYARHEKLKAMRRAGKTMPGRMTMG